MRSAVVPQQATLPKWLDAQSARRAEPLTEPSVEALVREEQIRALYFKGSTALIVNLLNALILVAALWPVVPHDRALAWLGLMYTTVGLRMLVSRSHRASPAPYEIERWRRLWLFGTFVTGVLWGS